MSGVIKIDIEKLRRELAEASANYQPRGKFWEPWEDDLLREFYGKVDPDVLVKKLGRTRGSVTNRFSTLGLTKRPHR